jgi:hypothetical protein
MKFTEMKDMTLVELRPRAGPAAGNVQPAPAAGERQLEKPARLRTLRKDIARLETRISQLRNKAA